MEFVKINQIINHIYEDGRYTYYTFVTLRDGSHKYVWLNSETVEQFPQLHENYWKTNDELHLDKATATSEERIKINLKPKFEIRKEPTFSPTHIQKNSGRPNSLLSGGIPNKVLGFSKEDKNFLVCYSDVDGTFILPAEIMTKIAPNLVIEYFMKYQ